MIIRRSLAGFVLSALITGGTLFVVDRQSDEANRTVRDVTQQSLDYQREMTESMKNGTPSAEQVEKASKDMTEDVIDTIEADDNVPDAAKAQLEAAKAQLEGIE
jgi:hypothetical protein